MKGFKSLLGGVLVFSLVALGACNQKDDPEEQPEAAADAYVKLSATELTFNGAGESASITVESNYDWTYSFDASASWFTIARDGDSLVVTVTEDNDEDDRTSEVTVSANNGEGSEAEASFTITEYGTEPEPEPDPEPDPEPEPDVESLVFIYTITEDGTTVMLPLGGTVDCTVDWGDDTEETVTAERPTHTYNAGEYEVRISGTVTSLNSYDLGFGTEPSQTTLTAVKQWGKTGLTSMFAAFKFYTGLASIPDDTEGSFSEVTDFESAFSYASITEIPAGLFQYATQVTNFSTVFLDCTNLTSIPTSLFDNCKAITQMQSSFNGCVNLTGESPYTQLDDYIIHLYERTYIYGFTEINGYNCFLDCTGLDDYENIPERWGYRSSSDEGDDPDSPPDDPEDPDGPPSDPDDPDTPPEDNPPSD